jgi:hypothetical protein
MGASSEASGVGSIAIGDADATETNAVAVGTGSVAQGSNSIALGAGAFAGGSSDIAVGHDARVLASNGSAFGSGAVVNAGHVNSTALGTGASTTYDNQVMLGSSTQTYTTPGITSDLSRSRQSGPLELLTTDANGNLASDNGDTFKAIAKLQAGVALALAAEAPSLTTSESFGVRVGWGNFDGDGNAAAISAIGVLCRNCLSTGDRLAIDGSVGAGWSEYKTYSAGNVIGGRAGIQWTW